MYREITREIEVQVEPSYSAEHSRPERSEFVFVYKIRITNLGARKAQLLARHWIITDGAGPVHEVKGPGVVGQQPELPPGASFEYSSYCPLPTPTGNMRGSYRMLGEDGEEFEVKIPLFFLRDLRNFH
jgi:ApaG protein